MTDNNDFIKKLSHQASLPSKTKAVMDYVEDLMTNDSTPTIIFNPSGKGKIKIWSDQNQEPITPEFEKSLKKSQYKLAHCSVCSTEFNEHEGIDVEQGEVCCSKECASQFDTL